MLKQHDMSELNGYNWEQAFSCCSPPEPLFGEKVGLADFTIMSVKEIIALDEGENDVEDWIGLFRLNDGRYVFISAGCDFTGWECRAGGNGLVSNNLRDLFKIGISDREKERMNITEEDIDYLLSSVIDAGSKGKERFTMMDFD